MCQSPNGNIYLHYLLALPVIIAILPITVNETVGKNEKRSYRKNIWGNVVGYVSGRREIEFDCCSYVEAWAEVWVSGLSYEEAELKALKINETK